MEIHQLRYFCAVAKTGNFTRAAAREHVAQPSLSQQILKMEDELGAKLFDRLGRGVRLTAFGQTFLPRAQAILRELGEATSEIQQMVGMEAGTIVFGTIPTIAPYFLPSKLSKFLSQHPQVKLRVIEEITPMLLTQLHEGVMDMALVALPVTGPEFVTREILREPMYLVVPKGHRLAHEKSTPLKEIQEDPFLLLKEGHCFRDSVVSACQRSRTKLNVVFETGQFSTILAMVSAGMGISVVPEMAIESIRGCRFIPLADSTAYRRIGLVWMRNHFQTRAEVELLEHLSLRHLSLKENGAAEKN
jgi:LysR family transcriptional regulator, hydrogen peroxide-inducible genes activator